VHRSAFRALVPAVSPGSGCSRPEAGAPTPGTGAATLATLRGLVRPRFPLLPRENGAALALHLTPLDTPVDLAIDLARRAWSLIRSGEIHHLGRRAPGLVRRAYRQLRRSA
jgi:hypothetical protein